MSFTRKVSVYGLCDPQTQELKYVGVTRETLHRRLSRHVNKGAKGKRVWEWIYSLVSIGVRPEIFEIEQVEESEWQSAERFWISYFKYIGASLVNGTSGGNGNASHSEDTKQRISTSLSGFKRPPFTEKHRERISEAGRGRIVSAETRHNLSIAQQKRYADPVKYEAQAQTMRALSQRKEQREKLSVAVSAWWRGRKNGVQ